MRANGDDNKELAADSDPAVLRALVSQLAGIADVEVDLRSNGRSNWRIRG